MKEIISQKKWVYTLYNTDDGMLLSVVCGGVAMFNVDVFLSDEDVKNLSKDEALLDKLSEKIRNNPEQYMHNS
ncbi:hypothetical protein KOI40_08430 [Aestuariicella sp. G3-2]|uniref:hypothetical protein n=1 Tax=Pseudomaricurvus albidus TaxID=2842452 RepID=UPI001C0C26BE|nr:hypothetical protein [Aestuariicella albida]MBU3069845.1 hypothetical protein [Aestuariicella albida]